jgi:polyhydroxyalkanoate synthesis regulator phasin
MPDENLFGVLGGTETGAEVAPPETSTGKETSTQGDQIPDEKLPFHEHPRWKEVYGKAQRVDTLEQELENLKNQLTQFQGPQAKQEEWQPKTWDEVIQKSVEATFARFQEQQQQVEAANRQADVALDAALNELKAKVGDFDEQKLLTFCLQHQISDVNVGYGLLKKVELAEKAGEKQALRKKVAPIGSSSKTEGGGKQTIPYKVLKTRTLDDIVTEAAERFSE